MIKFITANSLNDSELTNLLKMINEVYDSAEGDLFKSGLVRITESELRDVIKAGELILLEYNGLIKGCIQLKIIAAKTASFGLLAVAKDSRLMNFGKALIEFAENHARDKGCGQMQLDLLTPKSVAHKHKEFLKAWYTRCGYKPIGQKQFPLAADLALPCDFTVYAKNLLSI
jgi:GNAT superfamily N-acetyltransferase